LRWEKQSRRKLKRQTINSLIKNHLGSHKRSREGKPSQREIRKKGRIFGLSEQTKIMCMTADLP
jgi:hypothetical protein